jgi:hypothetical protein
VPLDRLAALHRAVAADRFAVAAGHKTHADESLYHGYGPLTDGRALREAVAAGDRALASQLCVWYFRVALRQATDQLRTAQATVTARVNGADLTHSQLLAALRACRDPDERQQLAAGVATVTSRLREERLRWLDAHAQARTALGFATHGALVRCLHPHTDRWRAHAATWLADTRADFLYSWRGWQDRDGTGEPRVRDLLAVAAVPIPGTAAASGEAVLDCLRDWGFAAELAGITADLAVRPGKLPMAFCTPVDPPQDIRICATPPATVADLVPLVHEYGHALHFAQLDGVEDLWHLDTAAMEAVGLAIEQVVRQPAWQQRYLAGRLDEEVIARLEFRRAAVRRLVAASLLVEMAFHDGGTDLEGEYERIFTRELGVAVDRLDAWTRLQTYLESQPCYPLVYTEAYATADRMWQWLRREHGEWYLGPQARPALLGLYPRAGYGQTDEWLPAEGRR